MITCGGLRVAFGLKTSPRTLKHTPSTSYDFGDNQPFDCMILIGEVLSVHINELYMFLGKAFPIVINLCCTPDIAAVVTIFNALSDRDSNLSLS